MNEFPLVSVLMTAYNREDFIAEAIESILASTYKNFELIIVDDCSMDRTVAIANSFAAKDSRITVYVNEKNLDQFPNRNKAATYANSKYIKYLDSDDTIYDWGLEYCVALMEKYPNAGMGMFQVNKNIREEYLLPEEAITRHFFSDAFLNIGPSGTILRTEAFKKAGYYNPNYGVPSDMYFNLKMASLFPVALLKKEFFFYRTHEGQEIKNEYSYLYNNYPCTRDIMQLNELPLSPDQKKKLLSRARKDFIMHCLRYTKKTATIKPVIKAFRHSGLGVKDIAAVILNKRL